MRKGKTTDKGMDDIFALYKATCINPLDYTTFSNVLKEFNSSLLTSVHNGLIYDMPHHLGFFGIHKKIPTITFNEDGKLDYKKSKVQTDWGSTRKLWREQPETENNVYLVYENEHTDGISYKHKWKPGYYVKNIKLYEFKPCRNASRNLATHLRNNNTQYYDF